MGMPDAEQVAAQPLTYPSSLMPDVLLALAVMQCWEVKHLTLLRVASQAWKENELRHS